MGDFQAMLDALEAAELDRQVREDNLVAAMVRDVPMTPEQIQAYKAETERRFREAVRRAGIPMAGRGPAGVRAVNTIIKPGEYRDFPIKRPMRARVPRGVQALINIDFFVTRDFFRNVTDGTIAGFIVDLYGAPFVITTKDGFDYVSSQTDSPHVVGILREVSDIQASAIPPPFDDMLLGVRP